MTESEILKKNKRKDYQKIYQKNYNSTYKLTEEQRLKRNERMKLTMREKRKKDPYSVIKIQYNHWKKKLEEYEKLHI